MDPIHIRNFLETTSQRRRSDGWASQCYLVLGEYTEQPRIRTIQTIILFCQNLQTTGLVTYADTFALSLLAVAQALRLHRLGEYEDKMPPDDPAFPPGKNSLKRQMALRIFGIICFARWTLSFIPIIINN
ncbi:hypothetical protein BT69DRAFT_204616 [Atractiella rhizophila]|nr:hypothetical protein BT69DRAFT_204616 [Atractiella rhizophila]